MVEFLFIQTNNKIINIFLFNFLKKIMKKCCGVGKLLKLLVIIGAINWGLVGLGDLMSQNWNVVYKILGSWPVVESIVYILVGLAGIMMIFGCKCKACSAGSCGTDKVSM